MSMISVSLLNNIGLVVGPCLYTCSNCLLCVSYNFGIIVGQSRNTVLIFSESFSNTFGLSC